MIAKISATENLGGALGYNFKKVEKGEASILLTAELYQNNESRYTMEEVFGYCPIKVCKLLFFLSLYL